MLINVVEENGMIINESKSKCMIIGTSQRLSNYKLILLSINVNGNELDDVDTVLPRN